MNVQLRFLVVMVFIVWLLPLGFFIKPSQEKTACGGQRAICMCKVSYKILNTGKPIDGVAFKSGLNANNERSPVGGGNGNCFVDSLSFEIQSLALNWSFDQYLLNYINPHQLSLEHVPKV